MSETITFKKSDMTYITDEELTVIKIALDRYRKDLKDIGYPEYIIKSQMFSTDRMIEFFNEPGILAVPYFPIDENE